MAPKSGLRKTYHSGACNQADITSADDRDFHLLLPLHSHSIKLDLFPFTISTHIRGGMCGYFIHIHHTYYARLFRYALYQFTHLQIPCGSDIMGSKPISCFNASTSA